MIRLPLLSHITVTNYGLFPGAPAGSGIEWSFRPGLSLIAGINGLGKTTLLTMILRCFTGPFDLTSDGDPQSLKVVLPENPVSLKPESRQYFANRVADGADNADVRLSAHFGETKVKIVRRLNNLSLREFEVDEESVELPRGQKKREAIFQERMADFIGVGSFVDVLLLLHHVILFHENRPGALWDPNAQRQLLRTLCLDAKDANRVTELERALLSADSQARNIQTRITAIEKQHVKALESESESAAVLAEIKAEQTLLDADLTEFERLREVLVALDKSRKDARLAFERAKVEHEKATGAIERMKYSALLNRFPSMDEAARLVLSRILADGHCLICNARASQKQVELEKLVDRGCCPICGAEPIEQDNLVGPHIVDQARRKRENERLILARREEDTQHRQMSEFTDQYDQTLAELERLGNEIRERERKDKRLRARLPDTTTSKEYESVLKALRRERSEWVHVRASRLRDLQMLLSDRNDRITSKSQELKKVFAHMIRALLVEQVRLVQVGAQPKYMQSPGQNQDRLEVPAYAAEMTAAGRPDYIRRNSPNEVSESQREIIDLAFRLALVKVLGGPCTFVMETPEASLDGLAMERVGQALSTFAQDGENRLVVTSNLTNAGIIPALFGGAASKDRAHKRLRRVLNLLEVAAPNQALLANRESYGKLLFAAVSGSVIEP